MVAPWLLVLLKNVIFDPIDTDPRTVTAPGTFLGWPKDKIFIDVLGFGQAEFDKTIKHLSGKDRAMLYARYNQPRHLEELTEAFSILVQNSNRVGRPTVIDLGCGPFTAGLAFAGVFGPEREFRYYGIDISVAMLEVGQELFTAAIEMGALSSRTTSYFGENLDDVDFGRVRGDLTIVVASYLLASPTLDVGKLINQVLNALTRVGPGPVAVLYTNSALPHLNAKYPAFKDGLSAAGFNLEADVTETFYGTKNPKKLRYALFFRSENTTINLS